MKFAAPKGARKICYAEFFYGMETGTYDEKSQEIEQWFTGMENQLAKKMDPIVEKILNYKQIEFDDKWILAFLMSMLWIRGQQMRNQISRMTVDLTKWMMEQAYAISAEKQFDDFDKAKGITTPPEDRKLIREIFTSGQYELKPSNAMHLEFLENIHCFANLFFHQHWTVYISKISKKFVTTDNPLAIKFPKDKGVYGKTFLERAHYFPLTPDVFILATESDDAPDKPGLRLKRKTLLLEDEGKVLDLNAVMTNQAHQYVYATHRQDLEDLLAVRKSQQEFFATPKGKIVKTKLDTERQNG